MLRDAQMASFLDLHFVFDVAYNQCELKARPKLMNNGIWHVLPIVCNNYGRCGDTMLRAQCKSWRFQKYPLSFFFFNQLTSCYTCFIINLLVIINGTRDNWKPDILLTQCDTIGRVNLHIYFSFEAFLFLQSRKAAAIILIDKRYLFLRGCYLKSIFIVEVRVRC